MLGIIDVREWQSTVDLATGKPVERDDEFIKPLADLAQKFPYPGDRGSAGIRWTLEAATAVVNLYNPGWLFLNFTQPYFNGVYSPGTLDDRKNIARLILDGIVDFARKYSFKPLIIGNGGLTPLAGYITIPELRGNLQSSAWSYNLGGVYGAEPGDEGVLARAPHIRKIISKEDFIENYRGLATPSYIDDFPDYLLMAEDGWNIKGIFSNNRALYNIEKHNNTLPVYSEIGLAGHIEEICPLMEEALERGDKVLLALVEGLGDEDFILPHFHINNCRDWYAYAGYTLYYTLVTGHPFYMGIHPPVYNMFTRRTLPLRYPMSSLHSGVICEESLGRRALVPTAAVGTRSMITHSMANADLTVECYIRSQANMGVLVAINEDRYKTNMI